ncbi:FHA domain-containing protein [Wenjunlia tyrosinilytica]|uniref:ABC transporter ATP-binding protein n=1 Tax=Wenjunlia tyrosinilytica TaxID=1544741 RepID=A0A917ZE51_9ACTN|nr:FHA domain-containing protein [Wenjunlia tyrosinilytica]GGO81151.1 ABC transporter ATP-binding protein [Wenjunlia tyrosinilytica]
MGDLSGDNYVGHGVPELVLELNGQTWTLDPSRPFVIGRDPQADVVINDSRVSWRHASIGWNGHSWVIDDQGSTNGTYSQGRRVNQAPVGPGSAIHLGNGTDGPRLNFSAARADVYSAPTAMAPGVGPGYAPPQAPPQQPPFQPPQQPPFQPPQQQPPFQPPQVPHQQSPGPGVPQRQPQGGGAPSPLGSRAEPTMIRNLTTRTTRIGRALDNELVVADLQVSRYHAEFRTTADGRYEIVDLGSHNGTYVNGQPIQRHLLRPEDIVGVGHSTFRLVGDRLEEFVDTGAVSFSSRRLTVKVKHGNGEKILLNNVSFGVPEKSLIGVIGPSGSGKSTLLRALTGYRPADEGDVLYDNRNLYKQFAELRQRIGLVPQDDILHAQLTVRTALRYAAKLRFPGDTEAAERNRRVEEVLGELKLDIHADKRITSLSGGQRKRVSVALELLTKPSLIFLDEPTSGLDPGMDRDVMQLLRGLADDGRTVLVVTHSVAELALCDRLLVMAPGGSVAYFGPPNEALEFFGYGTWADVFQAFETYRDHDWGGRWHGSMHYQKYAADIDAVAPQSVPVQPTQSRPPKPQSWGSQLWTLIRRYVSVIASDRGFIALMVILPAILGFVSTLIPSDFGLGPPKPPSRFNADSGTILLILAIGACFSGAANSVRELIKERVIYERERATGLSRSAYLMSKVIVLGLITGLQGIIICAIGFFPRDLPAEGLLAKNPTIEMTLVIMLLGFTSMMFGLVISSLVKTAEKTMPLLVLFAIVQVVFTGILFRLFSSPGVEQVAWLMPSRWAIAAEGTTVDLGRLMGPQDKSNPTATDPLWDHAASQWVFDSAVLLLLGVICGFIVVRLLRRHEPEVMRQS